MEKHPMSGLILYGVGVCLFFCLGGLLGFLGGRVRTPIPKKADVKLYPYQFLKS